MEKWKWECEAEGLRKKRREGRKEKERGGQEKHMKMVVQMRLFLDGSQMKLSPTDGMLYMAEPID